MARFMCASLLGVGVLQGAEAALGGLRGLPENTSVQNAEVGEIVDNNTSSSSSAVAHEGFNIASEVSGNATLQELWGGWGWQPGQNPACIWAPWLCQGAPAPAPAHNDPAPAPAPHGGGGGGAASCLNYGCGAYVPAHSCQCNSACKRHGNCCGDFSDQCWGGGGSASPAPAPPAGDAKEGGIMTLYHQTSAEIGALILKGGFKPGTKGWCGGGIYFATNPKATFTKAIGPDSHTGFMIEAKVNVGKVLHEGKDCGHVDGPKVTGEGYDTVTFNPGDGDEYVIYSADRVVSTKEYKCAGNKVTPQNC